MGGRAARRRSNARSVGRWFGWLVWSVRPQYVRSVGAGQMRVGGSGSGSAAAAGGASSSRSVGSLSRWSSAMQRSTTVALVEAAEEREAVQADAGVQSPRAVTQRQRRNEAMMRHARQQAKVPSRAKAAGSDDGDDGGGKSTSGAAKVSTSGRRCRAAKIRRVECDTKERNVGVLLRRCRTLR